MACDYCDWIAAKKGLVYEDDLVAALMHPQPVNPGHLLIVPRQHATIVEQLPHKTVGALGVIANKMSMIQFESLQALGTNMLLQNGVAAGQLMPHVAMHVIPRFTDDNLAFAWASKPLGEEQMATVELSLKEALENAEVPAEPKKEEKKEEKKAHKELHVWQERIP